jgi:hypothetical protein
MAGIHLGTGIAIVQSGCRGTRFIAAGPGSTRVELDQTQLDRAGEQWSRLLSELSAEGGWPTLLGLFAARAPAA